MEILKQIAAILITPILMFTNWIGGTPDYTPVDQVQEQNQEQAGAFNVTGGGTYRTKSSIGSTDSSVNLSSFKEPVSDIAYTMTYLNTTVGYGTIEPQTTRSEFISFTGITQNSDGSAVLTGVTRGLTRTPAGSGCTASTTLAQRHAAQSVFILSDSPCLFAEYAIKRNDESISGSWTFNSPTAGGNPTTKTYVDALVNGGTVSYDSTVVAGTAGETFATGTIIYFDQYQDEWMKADANTASTSRNVLLGIAQGAGTNGSAINGGVLVQGLDSTNTGAAANTGDLLYLSDTAGATSTSAGSLDVLLGMRRSTIAFYFDPTLSDNRLSVASSTFSGTTTIQAAKLIDETGTRIFPQIDVYTSTTTTHTWTKPTGAKEILVILVGGGGGGRGGDTNAGGGGGRGGGSGVVSTLRVPVYLLTPTATISVGDAGKGGAAGVSDPSSGTYGGATTFGTTTDIIFKANGGVSGCCGYGATTTTSTVGTPVSVVGKVGGVGASAGAANAGGGGAGTNGTDGTAGSGSTGGAGGAAGDWSYYGAGGKGADDGVDNATAGSNYGAGGGGGDGHTNGTNGKDGAPGIAIIITYF